ncbi:hypothetical protein [Planctellipticum variicoloris]|uniref:hypothetical protein n=1 Tax=Planctellipticum variicoloris TaxID=3064265 RepID=UPI003013CE56|nr:hypothetical protein SH412_003882 [Planctomycetaceae bacterium SH412]
MDPPTYWTDSNSTVGGPPVSASASYSDMLRSIFGTATADIQYNLGSGSPMLGAQAFSTHTASGTMTGTGTYTITGSGAGTADFEIQAPSNPSNTNVFIDGQMSIIVTSPPGLLQAAGFDITVGSTRVIGTRGAFTGVWSIQVQSGGSTVATFNTGTEGVNIVVFFTEAAAVNDIVPFDISAGQDVRLTTPGTKVGTMGVEASFMPTGYGTGETPPYSAGRLRVEKIVDGETEVVYDTED